MFLSLELVFSLAFLFQRGEGNINSYDCGWRTTENDTASLWPWMVAIMYKNGEDYTVRGSGALIDHRHVLTGASAISNHEIFNFKARIGSVDHTWSEQYHINRVRNHPGFNHSIRAFYNDIAILTLDRPVTDPEFNPVCLPFGEVRELDLDNLTTTVVGWGQKQKDGQINIVQQLGEMPVVPNQKCEDMYLEKLSSDSFRRQFYDGINNKIMCAGFIEGEKDICEGAGGGPLMIKAFGRWYVVGILSFGLSCGQPGTPSGFTRVSEYLDWISENTWS